MVPDAGELTRDVDPAGELYVCQRRALAPLSAVESVSAVLVGCGGWLSVGDMDTALSGRCMGMVSGGVDAESSHTVAGC